MKHDPEVQETAVMNYLSWSLFLPPHLPVIVNMVTGNTQGGFLRLRRAFQISLQQP